MVEETGDLGGYYTISFKRGGPNLDVDMQMVAHMMKQVHGFVTESDEYYRKKIGAQTPAAQEPEPVIEYG